MRKQNLLLYPINIHSSSVATCFSQQQTPLSSFFHKDPLKICNLLKERAGAGGNPPQDDAWLFSCKIKKER